MSDLTKVHSTTSSLPFIASNSDDVNLAPAYAIDSVAEPYNVHQKPVNNIYPRHGN